MCQSVLIDLNKIAYNRKGCLFYPCSGDDITTPLNLFANQLDEFWFVDTHYFSHRKGVFNQAQPLFEYPQFKHLTFDAISAKANIRGDIEAIADGYDISPCTLSETICYQQQGNNQIRRLEIHRRRGYGVSALRIDVPLISVFFYRGDSMGEGGSGNPWLSARLFVKVLARMQDQGLIVTDGSQTCGSNQYAHFAKFHGQSPTGEQLAEYLSNKPAFEDHWGNRFECLGYVGMRYGPTFVWKCHQSAAFKTVAEEIENSLQREYWLEHQDRKSQVGKLARKLRKQAQKINAI